MTRSPASRVAHGNVQPKTASLSDPTDATLWDLEEHFWTSGRDNARATSAEDAVMILPYPPGILQGDEIWSHASQSTGWRSVVMTDRRTIHRGALALLVYRVSAEKSDLPLHNAFCASTYLQDDGTWRRLAHQQTAIE